MSAAAVRRAPWRVAGALLQLRRQVNAMAPGRSFASDGSIGDPAHAARTSDHNPNEDGVVCAIDVTHDPLHGCDAGVLAERIRESQDARVKYVIYARRMFSSYPVGKTSAWTWRPYKGTNPHTRHVHVSVLAVPSAYDSEAPWALVGATDPLEHEGTR